MENVIPPREGKKQDRETEKDINKENTRPPKNITESTRKPNEATTIKTGNGTDQKGKKDGDKTAKRQSNRQRNKQRKGANIVIREM